MSLPNNDSVFNQKLIAILDKIIEKGYWEDTLFLQAAGKKLREFRERLKNDLEVSAEPGAQTPSPIHRYTQNTQRKKTGDGPELVFILIYSAQGNNLRHWETIINSLAAHSMTRPVYKNESDVQTVIRNKPSKQNDAYIAYPIKETDISPPFNNKVPMDRYGNELIVLKEGVIHPNNVEYFIHVSGYYVFQNGTLVRVENATP